MFFIFAIPFFVASLFHLISTFFKNQKIADVSKILLMPLLALGCISFAFMQNTPWLTTLLLTCALIGGTFGDYYMLKPKDNRFYLLGILTFFIGHVFYAALILMHSQIKLYSIWQVIILVAIYAVFGTSMYIMLGKPKKLIGFATVAYACTLFAINFLCITPVIGSLFFTKADIGCASWVRLCGNLSFLLSDSVLSMTIFTKDFKGSRFFIMLTYLTAQFLLATSFFI